MRRPHSPLIALAMFGALSACSQAPPQSADASALAARVQVLEDEIAVREAAAAIDLAVDAKDWDAARAAFTDQVQLDMSSLGGAPSTISADALVAGWRASLHANKPSWHLRGLETIAVHGDEATIISHGYAWNALPQRVENDLWEVWGRYEHHLVRTPAGWKVDALTFTALHERGDASIRADVADQ